jgi:hypothetical protein
MSPSLRSNKNKWSLPAVIEPEGTVCISVPVPNDPEWIAKFYGALYTLSQQIWWDRDETHAAQIVAARWQQVYLATLQGDCMAEDCDDCLERLLYNPATRRVGFYPTGEIDFYQVPDGPWIDNAPQWPTPQVQVGATDIDKRCIAARNAAIVLQSMYQQTWSVFLSGISNSALEIVRDTGLMIDQLFNPILSIESLLIYATGLVQAEIDFAVGFTDPADLLLLQNILFCESTVNVDGIVEFDLTAIRSEMAAVGTTPFPGLMALTEPTFSFVTAEMLNVAGGIHNEDDADCSAADCSDFWQQSALAGFGQQGFLPDPYNGGSGATTCTCTYRAIQDDFLSCFNGVGGLGPTVYIFGANIKRAVTATEFTRMKVRWDGGTSIANGNVKCQIILSLAGGNVMTFTSTAVSGTIDETFAAVTADQIEIFVRSYSATGANAHECCISELVFEGNGPNPF